MGLNHVYVVFPGGGLALSLIRIYVNAHVWLVVLVSKFNQVVVAAHCLFEGFLALLSIICCDWSFQERALG